VRILVLNPNTSSGVTDRVVAAAARVAAAGTVLVPLTAARGVPYISTRSEATVAAAVVLDMLAAEADGVDGVILSAFGDPGLHAVRELFDLPVVGMAEAAMLTASMLGRRFSIVSFSRGLGPWYADCVETLQMSHRLASIRLLDQDPGSIDDVSERKADLLTDLANRAVEEDGADVVIMAGAPLAGLAPRVRDRVSVPLVDGAEAAVKQIEALVAIRPRKAVAGSFVRPPPKPSIGLSPALAARLAHRDRVPDEA
jgi:allantoin racemase